MEIENDCYLNMGVLESESDGIYLDKEEKEQAIIRLQEMAVFNS